MQEGEQIAIMDRHSGPGPRGFEDDHVRLDARERAGRDSKWTVRWSCRRALGWRTERDTRREPPSPAAQRSCEKPEMIKTIEKRRAVRIGCGVVLTDLAAVYQPLQGPELAAVDPGARRRSNKEGTPFTGLDRHVGREGVGRHDRIGSHGWAAIRPESVD